MSLFSSVFIILPIEILARMRTLLFSVSCGGATTVNKDGRSSLAKQLLCTMALREVFAAIELVFNLGRPIR